MSAATYIHGDDVLKVETEMVEVTSYSPRVDPDWRFTDHAGHEHYYDAQRKDYPTLYWFEETWEEDGEEMSDGGYFVCDICGETITPGTLPPPAYREFIPGLTTFYLNDERITEDAAQALLQEWSTR